MNNIQQSVRIQERQRGSQRQTAIPAIEVRRFLYPDGQSDGAEIFQLKKKRWAEYWLAQASPVMLVIRTSDSRIRWMNVTDYLKRHGSEARPIVVEGEPFTALNVVKMSERILGAG